MHRRSSSSYICQSFCKCYLGKRCWFLNTTRNVKVLERHVGKEVHDYMKEQDSGTDDQVLSPHYIESQGLLEKQQLPEGARKVSQCDHSIIEWLGARQT